MEPVNISLFGEKKKVFEDITKLKILRWRDHPVLSSDPVGFSGGSDSKEDPTAMYYPGKS